MLAVLVACGGGDDPAPTSAAPTATSLAPPEVPEGFMPDFDTLPEATAPAGLSAAAWPDDGQALSAWLERMPLTIAGNERTPRFDENGPYRVRISYGEDPQGRDSVLVVTAFDLTEGDFFPRDTTAGQYVALFAQGADWEVLAAGREGDLAWVQFKTGATNGEVTRDLYITTWGDALSPRVFAAMASSPQEVAELVEAMVSAAGAE